MSGSKFFIVTVEDHVIQITNYVVKAKDEKSARSYINKGMYAFESEVEVVDTISSEVKNVEELG